MGGCCRSCTAFLKKYFVDLRFMGILMSLWLAVVLGVLLDLGVFTRSKFIAFGPRADLSFMHVNIDTYYKYNMLLAMIVCHTFITDLIADSLAPHVLNVVQDTKNRYIPHRARTYYMITSMWSIYCSVTQLFVIFIAFGQLDLLLVRLASDLIANFFTLNMYLDGKIHDPHLHAKNAAHANLHSRGNDMEKENHDAPILFTINGEEDDSDVAEEIKFKTKDEHVMRRKNLFDKHQSNTSLEASSNEEHSLIIQEDKNATALSDMQLSNNHHKSMNDEDDEKKALLQAKT
jgi:hypothetical protein